MPFQKQVKVDGVTTDYHEALIADDWQSGKLYLPIQYSLEHGKIYKLRNWSWIHSVEIVDSHTDMNAAPPRRVYQFNVLES